MAILVDQGRYIYRTILVAFLLACTYLFFKENVGTAKVKLINLAKKKWYCAFLIYASFLFVATVLGRNKINPYQAIFSNFGFRNNDFDWNIDIVKNIVLFIPYIFLFLQAAKPIKPFVAAVILSITTTFFIELSQLLFWLGNFQLADIVHNIIGGFIGFIIWWFVNRLFINRKVDGRDRN